MTSELLVVPKISIAGIIQDGRIALPPEEVKRRDELVAEATPIKEILTELDRDHALNVSARLKGLEAQAEEIRKQVKSPFLQMCDAIDLTMKEFKAKLITERERLNRLNGQFEQRRMDAIRKADYEAAAEQKRLALEAQRLEQEAAKAAQANDLSAALELEEKAQAASDKIEEIAQEQVLVEVPKPKGSTLRTNLEIKVLDIKQVYAAKPHLVDLTLNLTAAKHEINHRLAEDELIPGLSWQRVADLSARKR
jgi:hypothetical protein